MGWSSGFRAIDDLPRAHFFLLWENFLLLSVERPTIGSTFTTGLSHVGLGHEDTVLVKYGAASPYKYHCFRVGKLPFAVSGTACNRFYFHYWSFTRRPRAWSYCIGKIWCRLVIQIPLFPWIQTFAIEDHFWQFWTHSGKSTCGVSQDSHCLFIVCNIPPQVDKFWVGRIHSEKDKDCNDAFEPHREKKNVCHLQTRKAQISAFVVRCLHSVISILAKFKSSRI